MPRKDGVRGNSKKKETYSKKDWRASHPDNAMKGGKKTSKRAVMLTSVWEADTLSNCKFCGCPLIESMEKGQKIWRCPNANCSGIMPGFERDFEAEEKGKFRPGVKVWKRKSEPLSSYEAADDNENSDSL